MLPHNNDDYIKFQYNKQISSVPFARNHIGPAGKVAVAESEETVSDSNRIFVSKTSGNDITGSGIQSSPYATLLKSANQCTETKSKVCVLDSELYAEDLSDIDNIYFQGFEAALGQTPSYTLRILYFTPSDSNSIFVSKEGDDSTGSGTQAAPYATIGYACTQCDASHQDVVVLDSEEYEENNFEFTGSFTGLYAASGQTPTIKAAEPTSFLTSEALINTDVGRSYQCQFAELEGDQFVYVRHDTSLNIYFSIYDKTGETVIGETLVATVVDATTGTLSYDVAKLYNGNFVVVYRDEFDIFYKIYEPSGALVGSGTCLSGGVLRAGLDFKVIGLEDSANSSFVVVYIGRYDDEYHYIIVGADGTVIKGDTSLNYAYSDNFCCARALSNGNYILAFKRDSADGASGDDSGFRIFDKNGNTVKAYTVIGSGCTMYVEETTDGDLIFFYTKYDGGTYHGLYYQKRTIDGNTSLQSETLLKSDFGFILGSAPLAGYDQYLVFSALYYFIVDVDGNTVVSATAFSEIYISTSQKVIQIGEYYGYIFIGLYFHIVSANSSGAGWDRISIEWDFIDVSVASKISGIYIDGQNQRALRALFNCTASLDIYFSELVNAEYQIISSSALEMCNSIFSDAEVGIQIEGNFVEAYSCLFYRNQGPALDIDGNGTGIIINHNTFFANGRHLRLQNNDGSEVVKNSILHDADVYGIDADYEDTKVSYSNSVCTDSNNNAEEGSSVAPSNPLFMNEGYLVEDDIDLQLRMRLLGYPADSPAYLLADDSSPNRDAGAWDVIYISSQISWSEIRVIKPALIPVEYEPVGATRNVGLDGNPETGVESWIERVSLPYDSIEKAYFDLFLLILTCGDSEVRMYPDPDTYPDDYNLYKISYDAVVGSPSSIFRHSDLVVNDFEVILERAYESDI